MSIFSITPCILYIHNVLYYVKTIYVYRDQARTTWPDLIISDNNYRIRTGLSSPLFPPFLRRLPSCADCIRLSHAHTGIDTLTSRLLHRPSRAYEHPRPTRMRTRLDSLTRRCITHHPLRIPAGLHGPIPTHALPELLRSATTPESYSDPTDIQTSPIIRRTGTQIGCHTATLGLGRQVHRPSDLCPWLSSVAG